MKKTYNTPRVFKLGRVEQLTLGCPCGSGIDCECKSKNNPSI